MFLRQNYRHEIYLTSHLEQVHLAETDLVCDFCDAPFDAMKELISHRHLVHLEADKPYLCNYCGDYMESCQKLMEHLQNNHDGNFFNNLKLYEESKAINFAKLKLD